MPAYENAARAANITTVNRAAMFAAQIGHESSGLFHMEEIASGQAYEWRADLGNHYAGDGRRFKGSGPIQLTGRSNFRAFTRWANSQGHTTLDFEAQPHLVREDPKWGFLAASWYWVVARPQSNALSDAGNLEAVTRAINGGLNGINDRRARYHRALTMGAAILPGTPQAPAVYHPMRDEKYTTSSGYGMRWGSMHAGLDFAADLGTPIYAPTDGVVIQGAERAPGSVSGFGNWVWIDAQSQVGKDFIFGHMRHHEIYVRRGDRVKAGQLIARVGSEGGSTGPHLHFEVWGPPGRTGGKHEDPAPWLANHVNDGNTKDEELSMADIEALKAHITAEAEKTRKHITEFIGGFVGPIGSDVKDVRAQLTGGRDAGQYPGWSQLDDRTIVDAMATIGAEMEIPGFEDIHGGSLKAKAEDDSDAS
ncbi:peptidoglycan DD-metalloendopeptidase family protein [uncultured Corynebacterium sp.]|uniref:peptidoglycan DD-metalloendopeptidase family protein n=1 Tax=uncultured Corynebacterium sp. TaxID=159447 RepID=UPI0025D046F2|nr:peptidoglycan DD-metalloendopeptidase family protein [uncultured Corynebacterium sp.]